MDSHRQDGDKEDEHLNPLTQGHAAHNQSDTAILMSKPVSSRGGDEHRERDQGEFNLESNDYKEDEGTFA